MALGHYPLCCARLACHRSPCRARLGLGCAFVVSNQDGPAHPIPCNGYAGKPLRHEGPTAAPDALCARALRVLVRRVHRFAQGVDQAVDLGFFDDERRCQLDGVATVAHVKAFFQAAHRDFIRAACGLTWHCGDGETCRQADVADRIGICSESEWESSWDL